MTNYDLYQLIGFIAEKNRFGAISLGKYYVYDSSGQPKFRISTIFSAENRNLFDFYLRQYYSDWKSREALQPFLDEVTNVDASGSYDSIMTRPSKIVEARVNGGRFIEPVDNIGDWYDRLDKTIKAPSTDYPVIRLKGDSVEVLPDSISNIDIIYLKYPVSPVIDGYYDSDDNFYYLYEGQTVDLTSSGVDGTALDGTSDDSSYNSKTVEMEWYDEQKLEVTARILADLGISINNSALVQYSQMIKQED